MFIPPRSGDENVRIVDPSFDNLVDAMRGADHEAGLIFASRDRHGLSITEINALGDVGRRVGLLHSWRNQLKSLGYRQRISHEDLEWKNSI